MEHEYKLSAMDIWHFLAPLILEFEKGNVNFNEIYVSTFHALQLEEEWRKGKNAHNK